jgi:superfamily II DNA or RNA helicase
MTSPCPLCAPDVADIAVLDAATIIVRGPDALLLAPRRHVARWRDLTEPERSALGARIAEAQDLAAPGGDAPARVTFNETGPHLHLEIGASPARRGDAQLLIAGPEDALLTHLGPYVDQAARIDVAVAFAMKSGVDLIFARLAEFLGRDGRLRLLVGDYLGASDPAALRRLMDLPDGAELMAFEGEAIAFHPKSWLFSFHDGSGALLVGSSNLSASALQTGVEWNLRLFAGAGAPDLSGAHAAFERLFARPEIVPLTHDWIDAYEARRIAPQPHFAGVRIEPPPDAPEPHDVQRDALAALGATRARGHRAGLVVLATGLGKTFLAAFDSRDFARVLFVAHREEILTQAMAAFRAVRPNARMGRYAGAAKDRECDILFASVQTLARAAHLSGFDPGAFEYVVVDEFHHAAAATYRKVIEHFEPRFLLGLTATPERADGGDLLGLCGENLVFRCDVWDGIAAELLSPFTYHGLADDVDYAQIPWRGRRFDPDALTAALATEARARAAIAQLRAKGGSRAIGFCASQRHADFMARFSAREGLRAASVHAGPGSAPRAASLHALQAGDLDILFAVDMFNEGVDVPEIDTVLMLRPTESATIWMQQFGRGLRRAQGKARLIVIDYVGAHRSFLVKARAVLQAGDGDRALEARLRELRSGDLALPPGCEILYDTGVLDMMEAMLRRPNGDAQELDAFYLDFRQRHDARPTAAEVSRAGFDPRRAAPGGWFEYVDRQRDLSGAARAAKDGFAGLLRAIEIGAMARSDKMLTLIGMIDEGACPGEIALRRLAARVAKLAARTPRLAADLGVDPGDAGAVARLLRARALPAWAEIDGGRWFALDGAMFRTRIAPAPDVAAALATMAGELAEWRIAQHLSDRAFPPPPPPAEPGIDNPGIDNPGIDNPGINDPAAPFLRPERWTEYMREDIAPLFGATFAPGAWHAGIVTIKAAKAMILLVTLKKGALASGNHYEDRFEDPQTFQWAAQTAMRRGGARGRIISGAEPGWTVHLFIRGGKLRDGKAAPFRHCGPVRFLGWDGDAPIHVRWRLEEPVPEVLSTVMHLPAMR